VVKDEESLPCLCREVHCAQVKSLVEITRVLLTVPFTLFWRKPLNGKIRLEIPWARFSATSFQVILRTLAEWDSQLSLGIHIQLLSGHF
jgi:hypothetical protein